MHYPEKSSAAAALIMKGEFGVWFSIYIGWHSLEAWSYSWKHFDLYWFLKFKFISFCIQSNFYIYLELFVVKLLSFLHGKKDISRKKNYEQDLSFDICFSFQQSSFKSNRIEFYLIAKRTHLLMMYSKKKAKRKRKRNWRVIEKMAKILFKTSLRDLNRI